MMVFQEIVDRVRALSVEEQDNLIEINPPEKRTAAR